MNSNAIETIDQGALPSSLRNLHISWNNIKDIREVFSNLISLETLILFNNRIETIDENSFQGVLNLKTLDISRNKIKTLRVSHVKHLKNLETLHAFGNGDMEWEKDLEEMIPNFIV